MGLGSAKGLTCRGSRRPWPNLYLVPCAEIIFLYHQGIGCDTSSDTKKIMTTAETVAASGLNLPEQEICREAMLEKYAKGAETSVGEVRRRVARALAQIEPEAK